MFYSLSCWICVVQFLFSKVYNSFAHSLNLVSLHYWLLSFQKRFSSLCYTSLGQTPHRFASINSVYTNYRGESVVANRLRRVTKFCLLSLDLPIILWVTFSANSLLFFYWQKLCETIFANLKNLFSVICGYRFPDSRFRFPIPDSGSGFWFPGFRIALFRLLWATVAIFVWVKQWREVKDQSSGKGGRTQIVQGPLQALLLSPAP